MFLSRVSSISKPTGQFFCKFVSQSVKENRRSLSILSSRCGQSRFNSMQIMNTRSLFLSSSRLEKSVTITFVGDDGTEVKRQGQIGATLRDISQEDDDYTCMISKPCPSCHVILPKDICDKLELPTMLETGCLYFEPQLCDTSRLGCFVEITEDMDGMVVRVPSGKYQIHSTFHEEL